MGERVISEVIVFGESEITSNLAKEIETKLELERQTGYAEPVYFDCQWLRTPESSERFAAVLGALEKQSTKDKVPFGLRESTQSQSWSSEITHAVTKSALRLRAVFVIAIASGWWVLRQQTSEINRLREDLAYLERLNEGVGDNPSVDQITDEVDKIDAWKVADINWLEELGEYSERSLTPDDNIVDVFDAVTGLKAGGNARIVVNMRTTAVGKEAELIAELSEARFSVKPTRGAIDPTDKSYPLTTSLRVEFSPDKGALIEEFDKRAMEYRETSMADADQAGVGGKTRSQNRRR